MLLKFELSQSDWYVNPFPRAAHQQQTTLKMSFSNIMDSLYKCWHNYGEKVENIVTKGEIARVEQFLLLSRCFQKKSSAADASKCVYRFERVNEYYIF